MKNVLILVPSLSIGGMERVCINYANLLTKYGYKVYLYNLTYDDEAIIKDLNKDVVYNKNILYNIPIFYKANLEQLFNGNFRLLPVESWLKQCSAKKLYKKLIEANNLNFEIEIGFFGGNIIKIITGSNQKSIKLGWIHSSAIENQERFFKSNKEFVETHCKVDGLICVSCEIKTKIDKLFNCSSISYIINNPQNIDKIKSLSKIDVNDVIKEKITFINVSRIDINTKGYDRLVEAVKQLNDEKYDFDVWILGDGKDKNQLESLLKENNVNNIKLLGAKENPYKYMNIADYYICSSRFEGYSMSLAESIVLGLPIISTEISGIREMIGDSEYGIITENSTNGIYNGIKQVLESEDIRKWLKSQAIKRKDFVSDEKIITEFNNIINKIENE